MTAKQLPALPRFASDPIQQAFETFDQRNPHISKALKSMALQLKRKGHTHYSMDCLVHNLRVQRDLETESSDGYKINDHFVSRFSRKLMTEEPSLAGFFKVRPLAVER